MPNVMKVMLVSSVGMCGACWTMCFTGPFGINGEHCQPGGPYQTGPYNALAPFNFVSRPHSSIPHPIASDPYSPQYSPMYHPQSPYEEGYFQPPEAAQYGSRMQPVDSMWASGAWDTPYAPTPDLIPSSFERMLCAPPYDPGYSVPSALPPTWGDNMPNHAPLPLPEPDYTGFVQAPGTLTQGPQDGYGHGYGGRWDRWQPPAFVPMQYGEDNRAPVHDSPPPSPPPLPPPSNEIQVL